MDTATIILGTLTCLIAVYQLRVSQKQQLHDLFDRRFCVYDAARVFIYSTQQSMARKEIPNTEELDKFCSKIKEARWIFKKDKDNDIEGYLNTFLEPFLTLQDVTSKLEIEALSEQEKAAHISRKDETEIWFKDQYPKLDEKFTPFLQLEQTICDKIKTYFIVPTLWRGNAVLDALRHLTK